MRTPRPVSSRLVAAPAVLLLAVSLAACSGDDGSGGDGGDAAGASGSASASSSAGEDAAEAGTTSEQTPLPEPPRIRRAEGRVADISAEECDTAEGEQTLSGEVTNSGERNDDYLITISWVDETSNVLGRGFTVVERLAPGDTQEWEVSADVAEGATQCTQNVQRGRVRG